MPSGPKDLVPLSLICDWLSSIGYESEPQADDDLCFFQFRLRKVAPGFPPVLTVPLPTENCGSEPGWPRGLIYDFVLNAFGAKHEGLVVLGLLENHKKH